jgi:hypothetical protein
LTQPCLEFRPATAADQPAIIGLCRRSLVTTYADFIMREKTHSWIEGTDVDDYVARV